MTKLSTYLVGILFLVFSGNIMTQDALFSRMLNSDVLLNPAQTVIGNDPLEISLNFREQGASVSDGLPIRTFQVLANFSNASFKSDRMSYGLSILNDQGGQGHLGSSVAHLHYAYLKKLTGSNSSIGEHFVGIGTQVGLGQRRVGLSKLWFGNQFNVEYTFIDETKDPNEPVILANANGRSAIYTDINAGLSWYGIINDGLAVNAGFSMFHLMQPNISLYEGGAESQSLRYNVHFGVHKTLTNSLSVIPQAFYIRQSKASQMMIGTVLEMDNLDDPEFILRMGAYGRIVSNEVRNGLDALVLSVGLEYNGLRFGVGYDITVSSLSKYNGGNGAWELFLGYALDRNEKIGYSRKKKHFRM